MQLKTTIIQSVINMTNTSGLVDHQHVSEVHGKQLFVSLCLCNNAFKGWMLVVFSFFFCNLDENCRENTTFTFKCPNTTQVILMKN